MTAALLIGRPDGHGDSLLQYLGEQAAFPKAKRNRKVVKKAILSLMRQQAKRFYKLMKAQKLAANAKRAQALHERT